MSENEPELSLQSVAIFPYTESYSPLAWCIGRRLARGNRVSALDCDRFEAAETEVVHRLRADEQQTYEIAVLERELLNLCGRDRLSHGRGIRIERDRAGLNLYRFCYRTGFHGHIYALLLSDYERNRIRNGLLESRRLHGDGIGAGREKWNCEVARRGGLGVACDTRRYW